MAAIRMTLNHAELREAATMWLAARGWFALDGEVVFDGEADGGLSASAPVTAKPAPEKRVRKPRAAK